MLTTLFGFHGRLDRLAYFGWSAVGIGITFLLTIILMFVGAGVGSTMNFSSANGPVIVGATIGIIMGVLSLWIGLALAAKRVRDIGHSPVHVIGIWVTLGILDAAIFTRLTDLRFFWPFDQQTPIAGLVSVAAMVFMFFWPSQTDEDSGSSDSAPAQADPVQVWANPSATPQPNAAAPRQFGLRKQ